MSETREVTYEELVKLVRSRKNPKQVAYGFWARPFLPTTPDRGYEGCTIVRVTRTEFLRAAGDLLRNLGPRGAKLSVTVPTTPFEYFLI